MLKLVPIPAISSAIMKTELHPAYHTDAVVTCLCGSTFTTGSTLSELKTEVCSVCHPFFTGTQRIIDTGGQVERFRRRAAAKSGAKPA
jgi:large subunit ribosomal protein L31